MNLNRQKGIAQLVVLGVMAFLALGLPLTTKLVQQNQENRSQAAYIEDAGGGVYKVNKCTGWKTSTWTACENNGTQTRTVTKTPSGCSSGTPANKPATRQKCTPPCISGLRRCNGKRAEECVNKVWKLADNCVYGCYDDIFEGSRCHEARIDSHKCSPDFKGVLTYETYGKWEEYWSCDYGCIPETTDCFNEPKPYTTCSIGLYPKNKKICLPNNNYYYCGNGVWKPKLNKDGTRQNCKYVKEPVINL